MTGCIPLGDSRAQLLPASLHEHKQNLLLHCRTAPAKALKECLQVVALLQEMPCTGHERKDGIRRRNCLPGTHGSWVPAEQSAALFELPWGYTALGRGTGKQEATSGTACSKAHGLERAGQAVP